MLTTLTLALALTAGPAHADEAVDDTPMHVAVQAQDAQRPARARRALRQRLQLVSMWFAPNRPARHLVNRPSNFAFETRGVDDPAARGCGLGGPR